MLRRRLVSLVIPWLALLPLALAGRALQAAPDVAPFNVNSPADLPDDSPGNDVCAAAGGACTLRAAIQEAAAKPDANTINIPAGTYFLTIVGQDDTGLAGDLDISGTTTIVGAGADDTIIDASAISDRVLQVTGTVTIKNLTIRGGHLSYSGNGAGLYNMSGADTLLDHVVITGNVLAGSNQGGGGIGSYGKLRVHNSLILSNIVSSTSILPEGGGIWQFAITDFVVSNSTISENKVLSGTTAAGYGGGIYAATGVYTITHSTINANRARNGGGIYQSSGSGDLRMINSTVSGNFASQLGGGIYNGENNIALYNTTVTGNFANLQVGGTFTGGGVYVFDSVGVDPVLTFVNSIIAGNHRYTWPGPVIIDSDCAGTITSQGNNFVGVTTSPCIVSGAAPLTGDPKLGPLADNGGSTRTHALQPGSPAIDAGNIAGCTDPLGLPLTTDQRGVSRPRGVACDIGAFEVRAPLIVTRLDDPPENGCKEADCSLREAVLAANTSPGLDQITFAISGTIVLTQTSTNEDAAGDGDLDLTGDTLINGNGPVHTVIDGNSLDRVFHVLTGTLISINQVTIRHGQVLTAGGAGILNQAGVLTLSQSVLRDNLASTVGGALENTNGAVSWIISSTIGPGNQADLGAGAYNDGGSSNRLALYNSTISGNAAAVLLAAAGPPSTASGTPQGGGIFSGSGDVLTVTASTIASNTTSLGGGLSVAGSVALLNSLVVGNEPDDCDLTGANLSSSSHNLVGAGGSARGCLISGSNVLAGPASGAIGPLADNGGQTPTHALIQFSPALDQGDNATCAGAPIFNRDQRGHSRPFNASGIGAAQCDIGSYEAQSLVALSRLFVPQIVKP